MSFGILTLATHSDYRKAIGLALSLRVSNPGTPLAVTCSPTVRPLVAPFFDCTVEEDSSLSGFAHKLHLDRYTPFDETFFFDSDVLVFKRLEGTLDAWRTQPYAACGKYVTTGVSPFGLDRANVLKVLNRQQLVAIDGAGHAYFRKPECGMVFELAREIAADYEKYGGKFIRFADEDVMNIAMTVLNLKPMVMANFWSRYCSGEPSTVEMNAAEGRCSFRSAVTGLREEPYMMHFAADEAPFYYGKQLKKLFRKYNLSTRGIFRAAFSDFYRREIRWPLRAFLANLYN